MAQDKDVTPGPRSRKIRSDIDRTRAGIDRTLSELEGRLTTREIAYDVWSGVRQSSTAGAGRVWRAAQDYPLPATLIAVGVGWMLYESSRTGKEERMAENMWADREREGGGLGQARQAVTDTASRATETVSQAASDAAQSVRETAAVARERAADLAERTRQQAAQLGEAARERTARLGESARATTQRLRSSTQRTFDERPLAVGAVGVALGLLAGLLAPRTQREDELLGESRDRLVDTARERGREVLDKGRRVAEVAVEKAREVGGEVKAAAEQEVQQPVR